MHFRALNSTVESVEVAVVCARSSDVCFDIRQTVELRFQNLHKKSAVQYNQWAFNRGRCS
jgi:hypothetical protein